MMKKGSTIFFLSRRRVTQFQILQYIMLRKFKTYVNLEIFRDCIITGENVNI